MSVSIAHVSAGRIAVLTAYPDYTEDDWDKAVSTLVADGMIPVDLDLEPAYTTPAGQEFHLWYRPHRDRDQRLEDFWRREV